MSGILIVDDTAVDRRLAGGLLENDPTLDVSYANDVMDALKQVSDWREATAAWEKSSGAQAQRAEAIAELISILEDPQQSLEAKAASLRGLGLLGAIEELPRPIRSLGSEEKPIKEAARAALERLESKT